MPNGYSNTADNNHSVMYIGGTSNVSVYVNNCKFVSNSGESSDGKTGNGNNADLPIIYQLNGGLKVDNVNPNCYEITNETYCQ